MMHTCKPRLRSACTRSGTPLRACEVPAASERICRCSASSSICIDGASGLTGGRPPYPVQRNAALPYPPPEVLPPELLSPAA
jgi:hypothetical protein